MNIIEERKRRLQRKKKLSLFTCDRLLGHRVWLETLLSTGWDTRRRQHSRNATYLYQKYFNCIDYLLNQTYKKRLERFCVRGRLKTWTVFYRCSKSSISYIFFFWILLLKLSLFVIFLQEESTTGKDSLFCSPKSCWCFLTCFTL